MLGVTLLISLHCICLTEYKRLTISLKLQLSSLRISPYWPEHIKLFFVCSHLGYFSSLPLYLFLLPLQIRPLTFQAVKERDEVKYLTSRFCASALKMSALHLLPSWPRWECSFIKSEMWRRLHWRVSEEQVGGSGKGGKKKRKSNAQVSSSLMGEAII